MFTDLSGYLSRRLQPAKMSKLSRHSSRQVSEHLSRDLAQRIPRIPHIPEMSRDQNKARHPTRNLVAHKKTQGAKSALVLPICPYLHPVLVDIDHSLRRRLTISISFT